MSEGTAVEKYEPTQTGGVPMRPEDIVNQVKLIQQMMKDVMHEDEHYGIIPGTNKPSLLKAGAEKLMLLFRIAPDFEVEVVELGNGHREYRTKAIMKSIQTGAFLGSGVGSCSTMESKYRYRKVGAKCPECGKEDTIIKGKKEYGGGWVCFKKKGGCGAKYKDGDPEIENQDMGRVEYDNPADYYNTCLKMSKKRSLVDGSLTVTAASDLLTQDVEDLPQYAPEDDVPFEDSSTKTGTTPETTKTGDTKETSESGSTGKTERPAGVPPRDKVEKLIVIAQQRWGGTAGSLLEKKYGPSPQWTEDVCKEIGDALKNVKSEQGVADFLAPTEEEAEDESKMQIIATCQTLRDTVEGVGGEEALAYFNLPQSESAWNRMKVDDLKEVRKALESWLASSSDDDIPF